MYQKPELRRFGTFRELTQLGLGQDGDGGIALFGRTVIDGQWCCVPEEGRS